MRYLFIGLIAFAAPAVAQQMDQQELQRRIEENQRQVKQMERNIIQMEQTQASKPPTSDPFNAKWPPDVGSLR